MDVESHPLHNEKVRNGDHFHGMQHDGIREVADPHETARGETLPKAAAGGIVRRSRPDLDGGYGWVIVMASFFVAFIVDGIGSSFGLLLPSILSKFGDSAFVTSFAGSLFVAFLIMGSVSAELVRRFGFRAVTVTGSALSCVAFVAAAFSPNIYIFIVTYGLLAGCSCGLVFIPSIVIVNEYFHEKRGIANGIISSGSGVGLLVLAPVINAWLDTYSLGGTVLLLAGVLLNMCVFSCLFRPLPDNLRCPWDLSDNDRCSQPAVESLSSNLSSDNVDLAEEVSEANNCIIRQELAAQACFDISEIVSRCHQTYLSTPLHDPAGVKSTFYVEYMLSNLRPGVLVPPLRCRTSQFGHGCIHQKSLSQHWPHENRRWRSGHEIDLTNVQPPTRNNHVHSIYDMHTWSQAKDDSQHKTCVRGPKHAHDQHKRHSSSRLQSQNLSIDHSSSFYLAGSITTLLNLHNNFLQTLQVSDARELHSSSGICKRMPENAGGLSGDCIMDCEQLLQQDNRKKSQDKDFVGILGGQEQTASLERKDLHKSVAKSDCLSFADFGMTDSSMELGLPEPLGYTISQLLCMPSFHFFCVGASLIQIGYPLAGTFLANYAYQFDLTTTHIAVLMSLLGGLNICGRLLAGALVSLRVDPLLLNNVSLLLGGVACLMSPLYTQFWSLCLFAGMFGFFLGFFPPLQPLIIVKHFGLQSLASAFGFLSTVKGVASIVGAPLAGWIYDVTGQYSMSFMFGGVVFVMSSLVHCLMACAARCTNRNFV